MQKLLKKYGLLIVSLFFILVIILICIIMKTSINKYKGNISDRDAQINNLQASLTKIGELQTGYVVNKAVRAGEQITAADIQVVDVPVKLGLNAETSSKDMASKFFRVSMAEGTVITKEDVVAQKTDDTSRYFDAVVDDLPIGIKVGDFVDIRITFPMGEDFIAIPHKKVEALNTGIAKLVLNETEIYAYQSMLVDKAMYPGTKMYAVQYFDAGAQPTAEVYYPLNNNIAAIAAINPNLLELVKQQMIDKRTQLEAVMNGGSTTKTEEQLKEIDMTIARSRETISNNMVQSQRQLDQRLQTEQLAAKQVNK